MTVAEPFQRGGAQTYAWTQVAAQHDARFVLDRLVAALTIAAAEARCHNRGRALQALDAAHALDPDLRDPSYVELRARVRDEVPTA